MADAQVVTRSAGAKIPAYPKRIVSINPCADALLMQLADKRQIASVSHYSHDKRATSIPLAQALQFPATSGTAEEILAMRPDLVVAGSHVARPTATALKRMAIPMVQLSIPQSVAESQQQISQLAEIVGATQRGVAVNQRISNAFDKARPKDSDKISALIWRSGGLTPGDGTLPDELLRRTGFENVSSTYGLKQWDILPLEHLVARPPQLLFSNASEVKTGRKDRMLSHPVVEKLSHRIMIADYPARLMHCAGPTLIEAVKTLSAARHKLKAKR
ncbi:ABC transporter substrate-binding protein [Parasphingorhabdus cellanae]|uniref:ABC transporter substrate-binding protein n=2 Tax=Parasphingorhabdus cellanae TaxID=2806553 RepID=A0ABX7TAZ0_9SPHN|nr:ABC transporter substrate-binding protein [Parasphingorhabdus cellanae]